MKRITHVIRRALQASPRELIHRSKQASFGALNLVHSLRGKSCFAQDAHLRSLNLAVDDLPSWWSTRERKWFVNDSVVKTLKARVDEPSSELTWVLKRAEQIMSGKMPIFSHSPVEFTDPDRWHRDLVLHKSAKLQFYGFVPFLDAEEVGDSKHIWESSRFAWVFWLGIAYRITEDEKFAQKFAELALDWFASNPYPFGINYCSSLELAFRNYAWLWSLDFFAESPSLSADLLNQLLRGLWVGCRHIEFNLSTYFAPNTHITGEAFGLFATGAALPEFCESKRWLQSGANILAAEAKRQFHNDGMHRELSSCYHIYSTDFYVHTVLIAEHLGRRIPAIVRETARKLAVRLSELCPPDLVLPQINDCDGGRLTHLVPNALDAGPTLMAAASVFPESQLISNEVPKRGYALLMGCQSVTPHEVSACPRYRVRDSGLVAYRNSAKDYVLFRATPFGYLDMPHSHDAPLGLGLHLGGCPIFVDNGVGAYTQSESIRDRFRSAWGKNTILVDGKGPSRTAGWFTWESTTDCELLYQHEFIDGFMVCGTHTGFSSPPERYVLVRREIIVLDIGIVAIVDRWDADTEITVRSQFTVSPDVEVDAANQTLRVHNSDMTVHFRSVSFGRKSDICTIQSRVPYSSNYGEFGEAETLGFELSGSRREGIVTVLSRAGEIVESERGICVANYPNLLIRLATTGVDLQWTSAVESTALLKA